MSMHLVNNDSAADASDEELELITDYVAGTMDDRGRKAFEDRLAIDEAFFNRVAPYLKVWLADIPPEPVLRAGMHLRGQLPLAGPQSGTIRRRTWIPVAIVSMAAGAILTLVVVNQRDRSGLRTPKGSASVAASTPAGKATPDSGKSTARALQADRSPAAAAPVPGPKSLATLRATDSRAEVIEVSLPEPRMTFLVPDGIVEAPLPAHRTAAWADEGWMGRGPLLPSIRIGPSVWGMGGRVPGVFKKPPFRFKR